MSRIFLASFFVFWLVCTASFANDEDFYVIDDVQIHSFGDSPSEAKNKAFDDSRKKGLEILFGKLGLDPLILEEFSAEDLEETIKSEQVKSEIIAGSNYSAIFKITYDQNYLDYILKQKKLEILKSEDNYIALPITKTESSISLWEDNNGWRSAVSKAVDDKVQRNSAYKIFVVDGDIENKKSITKKSILLQDYKQFKPTLRKYKSRGVYLISFFNDVKNQKIIVDVAIVKQNEKKNIRFSFINPSSVPKSDLVNKVAEKTIDYLLSRNGKKLRKTNNDIKKIIINNGSYSRWLKTKQKITNSGLVDHIVMKSISTQRVVLSIKYIGQNPDIIQAFQDIGLNLEKIGENSFEIDN